METQLQLYLLEDGADPEQLDELTNMLREELLQLDVDDVTPLKAGDAPPGARAIDAAAVGALLVSLHAPEALVALLGVMRRWLSGQPKAARTVRIEIGGDKLELTNATEDAQARAVDFFVQRHTGTGP